MKSINYILSILALLFIFSCTEDEGPETPSGDITALKIIANDDTLNIAIVDEPFELALEAVYVDDKSSTVYNIGILQTAQVTTTRPDTTRESFDRFDAEWNSANSDIVTVDNGVIDAAGVAGFTSITASAQGVSSPPLYINVTGTPGAPGLVIDPPLSTVVFKNEITIEGNVQILTWLGNSTLLAAAESRSGFNSNISYNNLGDFTFTVNNLNTGNSIIYVTATHPGDSQVQTVKEKEVTYYPYGSDEADAVTGDWQGTNDDKNFDFQIIENPSNGDYEISGALSLEFEVFGLIPNIPFTGKLYDDGYFEADLYKDNSGTKTSGKLMGRLSALSKVSGEIDAKAEYLFLPAIEKKTTWSGSKN